MLQYHLVIYCSIHQLNLKENMSKILSLSISIYILISLFISSITPGHAQDGKKPDLSFDIKPVVIELQLKPGAQKKIGFEITNYTNKNLPVSIKLASFALNSANQTVLTASSPQMVNILKFNEQLSPWNLLLEPLEIKDFTPIIILPKNFEDGDYYLSLIFESILEDGTKTEFPLQHNFQIASLLFLTIGVNPKPNISLSEFSHEKKIIWQNPVNFNLIIKNTGRVRFKGNSTLRISNLFGKTVSILHTTPFTLLADSEKNITNNQSITWRAPNLPNIFTVNLSVVDFKTGRNHLATSRWFIYLPVWFILGLFFLFLLILILTKKI